MAWTSMHFAVGMGCAGLIGMVGCSILRRGWRWIPAAMTVGGLWGLVPDMPRIFREDFPQWGLAHTLGSKSLERSLHQVGDLFFFHHTLDAQPHEYALHGVLLMVLFYSASIVLLMALESRGRNSVGNRAWKAHEPHLRRKQSESPTAPTLKLTDPGPYDAPVLHRSSHLSRES